tara:strand:- start:109 stop:525 length:417 start_codon:yes stop_codon:yes gene_type:complete
VIKKKNISQEDINTWQNYIKNPKDVSDKDQLNDLKLSNVRFKYDLHGYSLIEANKKVKDIILTCVKKKFKEILLITGKGIHSNSDSDVYVSKNLSKLKYSVPEYIKSNPDISIHVAKISNADLKDGGEGAIMIKLKNL